MATGLKSRIIYKEHTEDGLWTGTYQYVEECKICGVGCSQPEVVFQMPADEEVEV